jgi:hypothetical protein
MTISIPYWAREIKDDGLATWLAFAKLLADRYGYDTRYYIHMDDMVRMTNKRSKGINTWLISHRCINQNMKTTDCFANACSFEFIERPKVQDRSHRSLQYELTDHRAQLVWAYLLGCLNHRLITDKKHVQVHSQNRYYNNSDHIKEFRIDREALYKYMPIEAANLRE